MAFQDKYRENDLHEQVAALPIRLGEGGCLEVLLITSRETQRWVIPKGNRKKGYDRATMACVEAHEEAGVRGVVLGGVYRSFDYWKRRRSDFVFCRVDVFLLLVTGQDPDWKERAERQQEWVEPEQAAERVMEPGLQSILAGLAADPRVRERLGRGEAADLPA